MTNIILSRFVLTCTQVSESTGNKAPLATCIFGLTRLGRKTNSCSSGKGGASWGRGGVFSTMGNVLQSSNSTMRARGRIASKCLSQKSQPSIIAADSLCTT